jgi:hypothetical protein
MIAELDTEIYDVVGKSVAGIRKRHRIAQPNVPFGRFFSQPVSQHCRDLADIRSFLRTCRYVSDQRQFGTDDLWVSPEQFETSRKGDCEDFALWVWRQLVDLGFECRFVGGSSGFYGEGHAWITVVIAGKQYLLEPQLRRSEKFPRLSVAAYQPAFSVEWDGSKPKFYEHRRTKPFPNTSTYVALAPEWLAFHLKRVVRLLAVILALPVLVVRRVLRRAT